MTFTVNAATRCAGLGHWSFAVTPAGGAQRTIQTSKAEMDFDPADDFAGSVTIRERVLWRMRSAVLEAGATTFAQIQTALVGQTFRV